MLPPDENDPTFEHRTFLFVDIEGSSERLDPHLMRLRNALYAIVDEALERSSLDRGAWVREDRGDAVLLLIDSAVPKVRIADHLLHELSSALARHNQQNDLDDWMRLRIALHAGEVQRDENGWGGHDLTLTFRLGDSKQIKQLLSAAPRAQCVIIVSGYFYDGVVRHGHGAIDTSTYAAISVPTGRETVRAWVRVPGYARPPGVSTSSGSPAEPSPASLAAALLARIGPHGGDGRAAAALRIEHAEFITLVHEQFRADPEARAALARAEQDPDDTDLLMALAAALRQHSARSPRLRTELEALADRLTTPATPDRSTGQQWARNVFNGPVTTQHDFHIH